MPTWWWSSALGGHAPAPPRCSAPPPGSRRAGADVIVGSHATCCSFRVAAGQHINYGLGNFVWYTIAPGHRCCGCGWKTGRSPPTSGRRRIGPLWPASAALGQCTARAVADWRVRRGCAGLASQPTQTGSVRYQASVERIAPFLRRRMRSSHHAGCPVPWRELRYLQMSYVGFDGRSHTGELVAAAAYARDVVGVFRTRRPMADPRMRPVDATEETTTVRWRPTTPRGSIAAESGSQGGRPRLALRSTQPGSESIPGPPQVPAGLASLHSARPCAGALVPEGRSGQATLWFGPSPRSAGSGAGRGRSPLPAPRPPAASLPADRARVSDPGHSTVGRVQSSSTSGNAEDIAA
jgi:hypothetical protein